MTQRTGFWQSDNGVLSPAGISAAKQHRPTSQRQRFLWQRVCVRNWQSVGLFTASAHSSFVQFQQHVSYQTHRWTTSAYFADQISIA